MTQTVKEIVEAPSLAKWCFETDPCIKIISRSLKLSSNGLIAMILRLGEQQTRPWIWKLTITIQDWERLRAILAPNLKARSIISRKFQI